MNSSDDVWIYRVSMAIIDSVFMDNMDSHIVIEEVIPHRNVNEMESDNSTSD